MLLGHGKVFVCVAYDIVVVNEWYMTTSLYLYPHRNSMISDDYEARLPAMLQAGNMNRLGHFFFNA